MRRLLFFLLALAVFSGAGLEPALAEELKVTARVDKNEIPAGQVLTFSVMIAGPIRQPPKVHLASFEGFKVLSSGQAQQIQIQGGKMISTLTLTYALAPSAPGKYTLGPVKIEYQGQVYETTPVQVTVSEGKKGEETPALEGGVIL